MRLRKTVVFFNIIYIIGTLLFTDLKAMLQVHEPTMLELLVHKQISDSSIENTAINAKLDEYKKNNGFSYDYSLLRPFIGFSKVGLYCRQCAPALGITMGHLLRHIQQRHIDNSGVKSTTDNNELEAKYICLFCHERFRNELVRDACVKSHGMLQNQEKLKECIKLFPECSLCQIQFTNNDARLEHELFGHVFSMPDATE